MSYQKYRSKITGEIVWASKTRDKKEYMLKDQYYQELEGGYLVRVESISDFEKEFELILMKYLTCHAEQMIFYKGRCYFLPHEKPEDWKEVLRENFPSFEFEEV